MVVAMSEPSSTTTLSSSSSASRRPKGGDGTSFRRGFLLSSPPSTTSSLTGRRKQTTATTTTITKQQSTATTTTNPTRDDGTDSHQDLVDTTPRSSSEKTSSSTINGTDKKGKNGVGEDDRETPIQTSLSSSRSNTPKRSTASAIKVSGRGNGTRGGWSKGFLMNSSPSLPSSSSSLNHKNNSTTNRALSTGKEARQSKVVVSNDLLEIDSDDTYGAPHGGIKALSSTTTRQSLSSSSSPPPPSKLDLRIVQNDNRQTGRNDDVENSRTVESKDAIKPLIIVLDEEETERDNGDGDDVDCNSNTNEKTPTLVASGAQQQNPVISILSSTTTSETLPASSSSTSRDDKLGDESPSMMWREVATIRKGPFLSGLAAQQGRIPPLLNSESARQPPLSQQGDSIISSSTLPGRIGHLQTVRPTALSIRDNQKDNHWKETPFDSKTLSFLPSISSPVSPPQPPASSSSSSSSRPKIPSSSIMEFQQDLERLIWQRGKIGSGEDLKTGSNEDLAVPLRTNHWTIPQARWAWKYCMIQNGIVWQQHTSSASSSSAANVNQRSITLSVHESAVDEVATSILLSHPEALAWTLQQGETEEDRRVALHTVVWLKRQVTQFSSEESSTLCERVAQQDCTGPVPPSSKELPPTFQFIVADTTYRSILLPRIVDLALYPQRTMLAQSAWELAILSIVYWMERIDDVGPDYHLSPTMENSVIANNNNNNNNNTKGVVEYWNHLQSLVNQQLVWQKSKKDVTSTRTKNRIEQLEKISSKVTVWMGPSELCGNNSSDNANLGWTMHDLILDLKQQVGAYC